MKLVNYAKRESTKLIPMILKDRLSKEVMSIIRDSGLVTMAIIRDQNIEVRNLEE